MKVTKAWACVYLDGTIIDDMCGLAIYSRKENTQPTNKQRQYVPVFIVPAEEYEKLIEQKEWAE